MYVIHRYLIRIWEVLEYLLVKIGTFNVNLKHVFLSWKVFSLGRAPDILCLQETKCRDEEFQNF